MPNFTKQLIVLLIAILISSSAFAAGPFRYMGDGKINIGRGYGGGLSKITFRNSDGTYLKEGLKQINGLYGTNYNQPEARMSLRLIELLDYLENHFRGKGVRIISGYRSPNYNQNLRNKGKLAASSSLHIDAEATDIVMDGISSKIIYDHLFEKDCCGIGYYHGKTIHIDTGPPRWWNEKTSGTEKKEPPLNEHITLKTKSDFYEAGNKIGLKFSRVTDYPIGVKKTVLLKCADKKGEKKKKISVNFKETVKNLGNGCYELKNRKEGRLILATLPNVKSRETGLKCQIRAYFCDPKTKKMPEFTDSNPFLAN